MLSKLTLAILLVNAATPAVSQGVGGIGVGCFDRQAIFNDATGVYLYQGANPPEVPCDCKAHGYDYRWTYSQYGDVGIYETCFCTNKNPDFRYLLNGYYQCDPGVSSESEANVVADAYRIREWNNNACVHPDAMVSGFDVTNIYQCLTQCQEQSRPWAAFIPHRRSSTATCVCLENSDLWLGEPSTGCGWENWNTFSYISQPPSAFVKRQQARERLAGQGSFCPLDSTACSLSQTSDSTYECIDTMSELESCGGCVYGELTFQGLRSPTGTDCTSLTGVLNNGVACHDGRCVVFACEDGYFLIDDKCVPQ